MKTLNSLRIILIFTTILLSNKAISQENYSTAYIITLENDTLHGLIENRNWEVNPKEIRFKESPESKSKKFSPAEILSFQVKDALYISAYVEIENSSTKTDDLEYNTDLDISQDSVFLQTFFEGEKSLYFYREAKGRENFYIGPAETPQLLLYKRYLRFIDGRDLITEKKTYQGQLTYYLNDCQDINKIAGDTKHTRGSMQELFEYYYKNTASQASFAKKSEKTIFKFGIVAGATYTSIYFKGDDLHNLADLDFSPSIEPSAGLFMDIIFAKKLRNLSLYNEFLFTSYSCSNEYVSAFSDYYSSSYVTEIGLSYLNLVNMIRYKYSLDNLGFFLQAGISNGLVISETNSQKHITNSSGVERVRETEAVNDIRKHEQGLLCGLGCQYKSFSLEGRYMRGNGMDWGIAMQSITSRWFLLMAYRF